MPQPRALRPYQVEAHAAVEEQWDLGFQRTSVVLPTGTGKALVDDTPVPTPHGWTTHGALRVGDEVFGSDGTPTRVIALHPQAPQRLHGVVVEANGITETFWSTPEHVWQVFTEVFDEPQLVTTSQLRYLVARLKTAPLLPDGTGRRSSGVWLPDVSQTITYVERPQQCPVDASTLARLLYFGLVTNPLISLNLIDEMRPVLRNMGITTAKRTHRIPVAYLAAPTKVRDQMLRGFAECQAMRDNVPAGHRISSELEHDIIALRRSLKSAGQQTGTAYANSRQTGSCEVIDVVEGTDIASSQCITVENPDGMYVVGKMHVLTHNSTVIAAVAAAARQQGDRVVLLAHREELLHQMAAAVQAVDPEGDPVGIVAAGTDEPHVDVVAASFQTLARSPERVARLGDRQVILVDEAHHATSPTFLDVIRQLGVNIPPEGATHTPEQPTGTRHGVRACGFTATMSRADKRALGALWSTVAYEKDLVWAIKEGFLVEPTGKTVVVEELNALSSIKTRGGDYIASELDTVMRASLDSTVDAIMRHTKGRATIVFAVTVDHAYQLRDSLLAQGLRAEVVAGKHSRSDRVFVYDAFNSGGLDAIITVQVLTEGADFPRCDAIVLARPTRSRVLLTQMVGRAVRPYTDPVTGIEKDSALVIDLTGAVRDTKLITLTDLWGAATTQRVDANGDRLPDDVPAESSAPLTGPEREGVLQLEHVSLYGDAASDTFISTTSQGVVYMPSGEGRRSLVMWPPNPQGRNRVYLLLMAPDGKWSVFRDDAGQPLYDTYDSALEFMIELGRKIGVWQPLTKRHNRKLSSTRQIEYAKTLNVPVDPTMPSWQVAEAISGFKVNQALSWDQDTLRTLTV